MAITPKEIKAKKVKINGIVFDSALEGKAYCLLVQNYGLQNVIPHPQLKINPSRFNWCIPEIIHHPDFLVHTPSGDIYLEIKGRLKGRWKGKAEYIKNLALIMDQEIEYTLWVGNGDMGFEDMDILNFAWPFPETSNEVPARINSRYKKGDF